MSGSVVTGTGSSEEETFGRSSPATVASLHTTAIRSPPASADWAAHSRTN